MYKYLLLIWLVAGFVTNTLAQKPDTSSVAPKSKKDTLISTKRDTAAARSFAPKTKKGGKGKILLPDSTHSPQKATLRSLIIPGWGQAYNHRWWKVPVIYVGLSSLAYFFVMNRDSAKEFLALAQFREHGTTPPKSNKYYNQYQLYANVATQAIYDAHDYYTRDRDLCIFGFFGLWGINIVDAYIDSKFMHSYTMDNNLSMRITPDLLNQSALYAQNFNGPLIPGIKITFTLK
jgi:hypothetical protein